MIVAQTFGRLPSEIARPLLAPDLPVGVVTRLDWYVFDVAAAARYQDLVRAANDEAADDDSPPWRRPAARRPVPARARVAEGQDGSLVISGDERPPWR